MFTDSKSNDTRTGIIRLLNASDADFICLQEHKGHVEPLTQYNHVECKYEQFKLVIYYKQHINITKIEHDIGRRRCMIGVKTDNMIIANIHLSPSLSYGIEQTLEISKIFSQLEYSNINIYLCGDFNAYDCEDYDDQHLKQLNDIKNPYYGENAKLIFESINQLKSLEFKNSFKLNNENRPMNTTRYGGVVDFIFLRSKHKVVYTNVLYTGLSDHLPVYCDLMEPPTEHRSGVSEYLITLFDPNIFKLSNEHREIINETLHQSADKYGLEWFKYKHDVHTIQSILSGYKASLYRPMNRFISINTVGDLFQPPREPGALDDTNPLIRCVPPAIDSLLLDKDKIFGDLISVIMQHYITMYIKDKMNPQIQTEIDAKLLKDYNATFVDYKSPITLPVRRFFKEDYRDITSVEKKLKDYKIMPIAGFVQYVEKFIRDGKCPDEEGSSDNDNQLLLMNVFLNNTILQLPRNPESFVTYRSLSPDLVRSGYYNKMFVQGAVVPLMHIQSTGLLPFDHRKDYDSNIMLEIHVPSNFPAFFGYMTHDYSREHTEILLPYCNNSSGNELSYAYKTRSYENKKTTPYILFDKKQSQLPEIVESITNNKTDKILLINADTSKTPPEIHKIFIDHYVVVDIIPLEPPIPLKYIPSQGYDKMTKHSETPHLDKKEQQGGYYAAAYQSHKQNYNMLKKMTL